MIEDSRSRFRPCERLRRRADFAAVFAVRCRAGNAALTIYVVRNELTWSRLGISTPKRVGGAVQRNCVRRRVREAFRRNKASLPSGLDIVCVAQPQAVDGETDLEVSFCQLVRKAAGRLKRHPAHRA